MQPLAGRQDGGDALRDFSVPPGGIAMAAGTVPVSIGMGKPAITGAEVALMDAAALRRVAIALQLLFTQARPLQAVFGTADLSAAEWLKVLGAGLFVFGMAELEKLVIRRRGRAIRAWGR